MAQYLPDLPLIEIFKHLGLVDLTRARAVSRRWRVLIDGYVRIQELVICSTTILEPKRWFHFDQRVRPDSWLKLDVFYYGFSMFQQTIVHLHLLASLKRLRVVRERFESAINRRDANLLFSILVKFTALGHLEIDFDFSDGWGLELAHPNLKMLSLARFCKRPELRIKIDCPRLETLQCEASFVQCTVKYPETIKHLYYYRFRRPGTESIVSSSVLEAFANVELYVCDDIIALEQMNIWSSMPKLKELRVKTNYLRDIRWDFVRTVLTDLIAKKERLGSARSCPKIYLNHKECSANLKESHPFLYLDDWCPM